MHEPPNRLLQAHQAGGNEAKKVVLILLTARECSILRQSAVSTYQRLFLSLDLHGSLCRRLAEPRSGASRVYCYVTSSWLPFVVWTMVALN